MADTNTTVWVSIISASSAIIAVVITQVITAINNRKSDARKEIAENNKAFKDKLIEIGENFYHSSRESIVSIKRLISILADNRFNESKESQKYVQGQVDSMSESVKKLTADTYKYNLTELYFDIEYDTVTMADSSIKILNYNTQLFEIKAKAFSETDNNQKQILISEFNKVFDEYIDYLKNRVVIIERDMKTIKTKLSDLISPNIKCKSSSQNIIL